MLPSDWLIFNWTPIRNLVGTLILANVTAWATKPEYSAAAMINIDMCIVGRAKVDSRWLYVRYQRSSFCSHETAVRMV